MFDIEKTAQKVTTHKLFSTYQLSILLELLLILLSFVLLINKLSSLSIFFVVLACLVFARIVYLFAIMTLKKEMRILYGAMLIIQTLLSIYLYFNAPFNMTIILSVIMIIILPILTHFICLKLK